MIIWLEEIPQIVAVVDKFIIYPNTPNKIQQIYIIVQNCTLYKKNIHTITISMGIHVKTMQDIKTGNIPLKVHNCNHKTVHLSSSESKH